MNPAFEQQTGLHMLPGRPRRSSTGGSKPAGCRRLPGVALTGESVRYQDYVAALGRWFEVYFFRVRGPHEHNVAAIFTDITEGKQREAEREAFIAAMTHDLKSPLTTVQGMAQLLARHARSRPGP